MKKLNKIFIRYKKNIKLKETNKYNKEKVQLYVGHNIKISKGFVSSVDYAKKLGMNIYQIFLSSPHQFKRSQHNDSLYIELASKLKENNIRIVIHGSYLLNFCNDINSNIHKQAINLLSADLNDSVKLDALGVIVHMGKSLDMDKKTALNNYVQGIKKVLSCTDIRSTLIFETGAGQGTEICTSIFDLAKLFNEFTFDEKKRIKFCLDTCHIFAAGYDLGSKDFVDVYNILIKKYIGWENICCVHLNNSKAKVNSRLDRHEDIDKGLINIKGLKKFVRICYKKTIPLILETPCTKTSKLDQINLVKEWIKNC